MKIKINRIFIFILLFPALSYADNTQDKITLACKQLDELEIHFLDLYTGLSPSRESKRDYFMDKLILVISLQNDLKCPNHKWGE